jgi:hypothetical protein
MPPVTVAEVLPEKAGMGPVSGIGLILMKASATAPTALQMNSTAKVNSMDLAAASK